MSKQKDDFSKDVESIFKTTIEINKQYLKQGTDLLKEFGNSGKELKNFNFFQPELIMGALMSVTKMNLDHYKNMMDLGFALAKKTFNQSPAETMQDEDETSGEPSFVLSATSFVGDTVSLKFILDNNKKEEAVCELVSTEYVNENDALLSFTLPTFFKPQSFHLSPGASQTVNIQIAITDDIRLGSYQSKVQVIGFEPAFFLIRLNIVEKPIQKSNSNPSKTTGNGRQKKQRPK